MDVSLSEKNRVKAAIMKKKKKNNLFRNGLAAAILFFASTITLSITNPALAEKIPFIGSIFSVFIENKEQVESYNEFASEIGITKESSGIAITILDAVYHGETITISYLVESERNLEHMYPLITNINLDKLYVRPKEDNFIEKINNNKYAGLKIIKLSGDTIKEKLNVNLKVQDITFNEPNGNWSYIDGEWSFDFTLTSIKSVTHHHSNLRSSENGIEVVLETTTTTPISTDFHLKAYIDEKIAQKGDYIIMNYLIKDDLGNNYKAFSNQIYHAGINSKQHDFTTFSFNEDASYIMITPVITIYKMEGDMFEKIEEFTIEPIEMELP